MENIKILDNFLNNYDLQLLHSIISSKKWDFGHLSGGREKVDTPFFWIDLNNDIYFSKYITDKIQDAFNKKFILNRVYANGQIYGQNGSYHIDSEHDNAVTFCLYCHAIENSDIETAGGNLYIKIPGEKLVFAVEPYANRGVLFPSKYFHKGCAFNRYIKSMRICIAWKLMEDI